MYSLSLIHSLVSIKLITDGHIYSIKLRWWRFTSPSSIANKGERRKLFLRVIWINRRKMIHYANRLYICTACGFILERESKYFIFLNFQTPFQIQRNLSLLPCIKHSFCQYLSCNFHVHIWYWIFSVCYYLPF